MNKGVLAGFLIGIILGLSIMYVFSSGLINPVPKSNSQVSQGVYLDIGKKVFSQDDYFLLKLINNRGSTIETGIDIYLYTLNGGNWIYSDKNPDAWPIITKKVKPGETIVVLNFSISAFKLEPGTYKIVKWVTDTQLNQKIILETEFQVK